MEEVRSETTRYVEGLLFFKQFQLTIKRCGDKKHERKSGSQWESNRQTSAHKFVTWIAICSGKRQHNLMFFYAPVVTIHCHFSRSRFLIAKFLLFVVVVFERNTHWRWGSFHSNVSFTWSTNNFLLLCDYCWIWMRKGVKIFSN